MEGTSYLWEQLTCLSVVSDPKVTPLFSTLNSSTQARTSLQEQSKEADGLSISKNLRILVGRDTVMIVLGHWKAREVDLNLKWPTDSSIILRPNFLDQAVTGK